jgi:Flp pilus assembly protein TadG
MRRVLRRQHGQALILVAMAVLVLTAILALALDGGRIYLDRRQLQDAADAGALAGAEQLQILPYPSYSGSHTQALQFVVKNLPGTSTSGLAAPSAASWGPLNIGAGYTVTMTATPTTYQVTLQHSIATMIAPVHGFAPTMQLQVQATATNGTLPFALVLLQRAYSPNYANLQINGVPAKLILSGGGGAADRGGVYSNASANLGQGTVQFGTSGVCPPDPPATGNNGEIWTVTPTSLPIAQVICPQAQGQAHSTTQVLNDPGYPEPPAPTFVATNGASVLNGPPNYLCPGHYGNKIQIQGGGTGVLLPGVFHVDAGGVAVAGTLRTLDSALDTFPIPAASTNCNQGVASMPADPGVIIEITPANTSGQTTCNQHQFSVNAAATVTLRPSPKYYNISLYIETMPNWQTTCATAPTGTNVVAILGNSTYSIYGAIYGPADNMQIGGSGAGWGVGQIVAWTMKINGGGSGANVTETFDPTKIPIIKGLIQ